MNKKLNKRENNKRAMCDVNSWLLKVWLG